MKVCTLLVPKYELLNMNMSFLKLITSVNKATLDSYNICGIVSLDTMNSALTAMNDMLPSILTEL